MDGRQRVTQRTQRFRRDLYWIIPVGVLTAAATFLLARVPEQGADIATILALPVAVVATMAGILAVRSGTPTDSPARAAGGHRMRYWPVATLAGVTLCAMLAAILLHLPSDGDDVAQQLSGRLRIGITGVIPGWSEKNGERYEGFEIALIDYLQARHGFRPQYVELHPEEQTAALESGRVDILVGNYTIWEARNATVVFAGPYYMDKVGIYVSARKVKKPPVAADLTGCALPITYPRPDDLGVTFEHASSLQECMLRLFDPEDRINAVFMHHSILVSLAVRRGLDPRDIVLFKQHDYALYAIGLAKRNQKLCQALGRDIDLFLNQEWDRAAARHLPYLDGSGKPLYSYSAFCD
ncbi:transporter substrate-binding domain-containing protein [Micromonospora sp. NPDC048986]|uniref:transporter substrate-binding domain-containing protein n=1 Tax=Micromonospora sp. NPDC048986 TaxID=3155644 RepID=UPI0033D6B91A